MSNMCLKPAIRGMMKKNSINTQFFDKLCSELNIYHKTIRQRIPWHNGKVERSHRNDQERFYNHLKFYSYNDLLIQMKRYLKRSNNIPMAVLGWKTPLQKRKELENALVSPTLRYVLFSWSLIIDKPTNFQL